MKPTPEMIEAAARTIIMEHYAAYDIRMQEGVARIMATAALTAALAVMWRPIETAPKDGTAVLIPRDQYDALMAAAEVLLNELQGLPACGCDKCRAVAALRAAGVEMTTSES